MCFSISIWGGGSCQKSYGPFLGTLHNRCRILKGDPKRDHQFDNHSYVYIYIYMCVYMYVCMYVCMYVYIYMDRVRAKVPVSLELISEPC